MIGPYFATSFVLAVACPLTIACSRTEPITGYYESPATAALVAAIQYESLWRAESHEPLPIPSELTINLPPEEGFVTAAVSRDLEELQRLTVFEDSDRYAARRISDDSLRVLRAVYDIRKETPEEVDSIVARALQSGVENGFTLLGDVYVVRQQRCRRFHCYRSLWVEVRSTSRGFAAFQVLQVVVD